MARFLNKDGNTDDLYFEPTEGDIQILLNEDNFVAHMHRKTPWIDMVGIEDPRDEAWWHWYRCDRGTEEFSSIMGFALEVGTVVMRNTPMEHVQQAFDGLPLHQARDDELDRLLDGDV
jgi:hypothetical protein